MTWGTIILAGVVGLILGITLNLDPASEDDIDD